jgi:hypothetical protein
MDDVEGVRTLGLLRTSTSAGGTAAGTVDGEREAPTGARARADAVLEAVARRDFGGVADALPDDVHLRALLPGGFREWHGRAAVNAAFSGWFDGFDEYELVDAEVCEVGARLRLSWRLRVCAAKDADRSLVVEQHVYADVDADDRISRLSLLCSGFSRERVRG